MSETHALEDWAAMLARDEIRQLPYRYAAAIEARDVDAMAAAVLAPQARFGEFGDGPDGLRRLMTHSLEGSVFAVILVANHLIESRATTKRGVRSGRTVLPRRAHMASSSSSSNTKTIMNITTAVGYSCTVDIGCGMALHVANHPCVSRPRIGRPARSGWGISRYPTAPSAIGGKNAYDFSRPMPGRGPGVSGESDRL